MVGDTRCTISSPTLRQLGLGSVMEVRLNDQGGETGVRIEMSNREMVAQKNKIFNLFLFATVQECGERQACKMLVRSMPPCSTTFWGRRETTRSQSHSEACSR